ncbi:hypothetical protein [Cetobacterium sp.]|uniref:hypothetical protein n=1 Tax=Cetobacterium sp. TaxID=2071632 RepID=UPI003F3F53B8
MKKHLLDFYEKYNIKNIVFKEWILKNSLVVLINTRGEIKSIFLADKNNKSDINYPKVAKYDLYSLTLGSNYSVIQKSDSNNEFSFMFKKEKKSEDNIALLESYKESLKKKLDVDLAKGIGIALSNLLKIEEFIDLKDGSWVKIFTELDEEKYIEAYKRYIESRGEMDIFLNTANSKKTYLSDNATTITKNIQKAQGEELEKFSFLDKFFYLQVKQNKTFIYYDNLDSENFKCCSKKDVDKNIGFKGYLIEVGQDNGRGILINFKSVNKKIYNDITLLPLYKSEHLSTMKKEILSFKDFVNFIYVFFKIDWADKNKRSRDINSQMILDSLDSFVIYGTTIPFKHLKRYFLNVIIKTFFSHDNIKVMNQLNLFNTIYKEEYMECSSLKLGRVVRYLERKVAKDFGGDYRGYFRDMNFKSAKRSLEQLIAYHHYNVYACKNRQVLEKDILEILNTDDSLKVDNIQLLKGYLEEIKYYGDKKEEDLCSQENNQQ